MKVSTTEFDLVTELDLETVRGGDGEDGGSASPPAASSSTTNWKECAADVGKLAAGSALVLGSKMPASSKLIGSGLMGFEAGRNIGESCPPAVQRVFGVGKNKMFPQGSFR